MHIDATALLRSEVAVAPNTVRTEDCCNGTVILPWHIISTSCYTALDSAALLGSIELFKPSGRQVND
jgi:hypothetical protein